MQKRKKIKKIAAEIAEEEGRLLLTMGWNRSSLNIKAGLVLLKKKLSSYRLEFSSFINKRVEALIPMK